MDLVVFFGSRDVAPEENVVVHLPEEVVSAVASCHRRERVPGVADELSLGHLVFDVRGSQVHRQQDQREAHHIDGIYDYKWKVDRFLSLSCTEYVAG